MLDDYWFCVGSRDFVLLVYAVKFSLFKTNAEEINVKNTA